LILANVQTNVA